ncbi:serine/threonine-protein kinase OXI1-like [Malania oleifera]|uniref:serine/threonine-protein kinase OXI1-like n=1 Tax=Malania oleifera TaxID=397392 RepID=UPI0025ADA58F|nr:serine/threonine-protein kinase OXI1-like [Malania oleifera]
MDDDEGLLRRSVRKLHLSQLQVVSALGRGAKGVVFLVRDLGFDAAADEFFALKVISKALIAAKGDGDSEGSRRKRVRFEQLALSRFRHPLLPSLHGVFESEKLVGYAIGYCPGRDLHSLRKRQTEKMFSDDIIRFYAAELVLALEYLHGLGIVYRDLKPENIMIQENGHLMLVDFDLSTELPVKTPQVVNSAASSNSPKRKRRFSAFYKFRRNSGISPDDSAGKSNSNDADRAGKSNSFVGTEEYVAPEIILGNGHDFAVDWWSLGVVLYEMLYGATPFRGSSRKDTFYRILAKEPELVGEATSLRDLIRKLLEKDPKQRIGVEGIKGHDFFKAVDWDTILQIQRPPFIPLGPDIEDVDGNKGIDLESFVEDAHKKHNDEKTNTPEQNKSENTNEGVWINQNNNSEYNKFSIF